MTMRRVAALALAVLLAANAVATADEPKLPDAKAFDKLMIDTLRGVHNTGADLYNEKKDFPGAYQLYRGALMTARPLLGHRPDTQKIIDAGLADAEKEPDAARKAFLLHVAIEGVRKNLKAAVSDPKPVEPPKPKPDEPKKVDPPLVKKPDEPKKPSGLPVAPPPKEVKPK